MQNNDELMIFERMTDSEVLRAIRYLDPDFIAEGSGEDAGAVLRSSFTLITVLTGALAYLGLYVRTP